MMFKGKSLLQTFFPYKDALYLSSSNLEALHSGVIHYMRRFALSMSNWEDYKGTAGFARDTCTACAKVMQEVLGLKRGQLHCCLKAMCKDQQQQEKVWTWARSEPIDHRPAETGVEHGHLVSENTVWSALLGKNDSLTNWGREGSAAYRCFSCNDLGNEKNHKYFQCSRKNWQTFYQATLVFPLCYYDDPDSDSPAYYMGFLAFDSPLKNVFKNLPNIFEHRGEEPHEWSDYHSKLAETLPFHLGAIMADTLSMFLRAPYEKYLIKSLEETTHGS